MKNRLLFFIILSISISAGANPGWRQYIVTAPAVADTFCRDTTVCIEGDPFNLNLLCSPAGGVFYGSLAILGDQFNPVSASIGPNTVYHGIVHGSDTIAWCSFVVTVADTVYPAGVISGKGNVCQGQSAQYTLDPVANATSYLWRLSGSNIRDTVTDEPAITLLFDHPVASGSLSVQGMNAYCSEPGIVSDGFNITVNEKPVATIRNVNDTLNFTDSLCRNSRMHYITLEEYRSYRWSAVNGTITGDSLSRNVTIDWDSVAGNGVVSVIVEDQNGCAGSSLRNVVILNTTAPDPSNIWLFGYNMLVCSDSTVNSFQWYLETNLIPGATGRYFLADTSSRKNYYVQTCFDDCCNMSGPFSFFKPSGIPDLTRGGMLVYPNPASQIIHVRVLQATARDSHISLYNLYGSLVIEKTVANGEAQIDIERLPCGIYYIRCIDRSGGIHTTKVIKFRGE